MKHTFRAGSFMSVPPRQGSAGLETRIAAAKLTAIRAREAARTHGEDTDFGKRMIAQAVTWEKRAQELTGIQRGRQTTAVTIVL